MPSRRLPAGGGSVAYFFPFPFFAGVFFGAAFFDGAAFVAAAGLLVDFLPPKASSQPAASLGFDPRRVMVTKRVLQQGERKMDVDPAGQVAPPATKAGFRSGIAALQDRIKYRKVSRRSSACCSPQMRPRFPHSLIPWGLTTILEKSLPALGNLSGETGISGTCKGSSDSSQATSAWLGQVCSDLSSGSGDWP
jgi:hypothetical protein